MTRTILVTGASGFVGSALCIELARRGYAVRAAVRESLRATGLPGEIAVVGELGGDTDWSHALARVDTVIHLAARVHVMREEAVDPLAAFRIVNVEATQTLAREAAARGAKRFVYVSSIGVHGSRNVDGALDETSMFDPDSPYALTKLEGERAVIEASRATPMETVIVRPPLVYGPHNPGNFLRLLRLVELGLPLPLASVDNRRSMIYVGNLVDALIACATHAGAAGNAYLVADGEDVSTPYLIERLAALMGRPARLWPFPPALLRMGGRLTGKSAEVDRLIGSLRVESSRVRSDLGWTPPFPVEFGLAETARWYRAERAGRPA